jgi:septation ring formation regulator EzrA
LLNYDKKRKEMRNRLLVMGTQRRKYRFEEIDFIGGNLYEIEDIIGDIGKIIDKSNKKNLSISNKLKLEYPQIKSRWLNSKLQFGGTLSKLDEMLRHYKSIPDD